ncbi:MAG TPA: FAD-dependent oxidoreductase [Solirubrobacteraceae bacterium]|nr:FAD-dependent oxidoreductase [Solirubrobacteraceae bacterium]
MAISVVLSELQRATLTRLCDTFVPALEEPDDPTGFWARAASDIGVPDAIEQTLETLSDEQLAGMRQLLDAVAAEGFNEAELEAREQLIHAFADSSPETLAGISALRAMTTGLFYALPDPATGRNANWDAIGYPGPLAGAPDVPKTIRPLRPAADGQTLEADVCIVGSGCGGGVVAGVLAGNGSKVVVLEAGGYFNESDFNQLELWANQNLYLGGGPFLTAEGQVALLAGSCLGGGSTVNWMNCLRTFPHVREQWEGEFGLEGLAGPEYDRHLDAVMERMGVNGDCSDPNGPHERLREGCERLGYDFRKIVRNADRDTYDPGNSGFIGYGDQSGSKMGTLKTYLQDAADRGAEIVVNCRAQRILVEDGRAAGVEATYTDSDGQTVRTIVRAPQVVVAGGALESPALLLRSGIGGPAAGDYLRVHPSTALFGVYDEEQRGWWGAPQAALSHEFEDVDDGYGFLIECPHLSTGTFGSSTPWHSGRQHKQTMAHGARTSAFIFLIRDRGHGRVTIDTDGNAVHAYRLSDEGDTRLFRRGLLELAKLHRAAGAREIVALGRKLPVWRDGEDFDSFLDAIEHGSLAPYEHAIFSAHQMGTCRMGSDPQTSVAGPWGELHDVGGVWIADASAFPTASGTNPMITTMALAHRTAEAVAQR